MPLAKPHPKEDRKTFVNRCYGDPTTRAEFKDDNDQIGGYCFTAWKEHKAAHAGMVVHAGDNEYLVEAALPPTVKSVPQSPINDNGSDQPNSAPPAIPYPADAPPKSSQPKEPSGDDGSNPPPGPGTDDNDNPEYVGGRKVDPKPLPNPEGGGLAPNPDNATIIPEVDTYDDKSAKPGVSQLNWLMAGKQIRFKTNPKTGMASWPLSFEVIDKDVVRPSSDNPPDHAKDLDPAKDFADNRPYVI